MVEKINKINGEECVKTYKRGNLLGKGGFANCYLTELAGTNKKVAMKVINKSLLESFRTKLRLNN